MPNTPEVWIPEFTANTTTSGTQNGQQIIQLSGGNILTTWVSSATTGVASPAGNDIIGQILDPLGNPIGGEFRVNVTRNADDERDASIAATNSGGFVAVYVDYEAGAANDYRIQLDQFNSSGSIISNQQIDLSGSSTRDPQVAVSSSTSALVVWIEDGTDDTVHYRTYNPTTNALGAETTAFTNSSGTGSISNLDMTTLTNGSYVLVAQSDNGTDDEIWIRTFNSSGTPTSFTQLASTEGNGDEDHDPSVTALTGGGYVVSWDNTDTNDTDIQFQIFTSTGTLVGGVTTVASGGATDNNNQTTVVALADGGFIVLWDDDESGQTAGRGQRYNATGSAVGSGFTFDANDGSQIDAVLLDDGRVAISFVDSANTSVVIYDTRDAPNTTGNTIVGTVGNDTFTANGGSQDVYAWDGNDVVTSAGGTRLYDLGNGNDQITVTSAVNADHFIGGAGSDTIDWSASGESGLDINLVTGLAEDSGGSTEVMSGFENVAGTSGHDAITGTSSANIIYGLGGNDTILGGGGDDTIDGGAGDDEISTNNGYGSYSGGIGDDLMIAGNSIESMDGGTGTDTVDMRSFNGSYTVDMVSGTTNFAGESFINFENIIMGNGTNNVTGTNGSNVMTGGTGSDIFNGGIGNDELNGGAGNDTLTGGSGIDSVNGGTGDDVILGSIGHFLDHTNGGSGTDTLDISAHSTAQINGDTFNFLTQQMTTYGGVLDLISIESFIDNSGSNTVFSGGHLVLNMGAGNDTVHEAAVGGTNTFMLGSGDDVLHINNSGIGGDNFDGGIGFDTIDFSNSNLTAGASINLNLGTLSLGGASEVMTNFENAVGSSSGDFIFGTAGVNNLVGGDGDDRLYGLAGNDNLQGGADDDLLRGDAGNDVLGGGAGIDTASYSTATDGVSVNLGLAGAQFVSASAGTDTLTSIENLIGSDFADFLQGDGSSNSIEGQNGNDDLRGFGGDDAMFGGNGHDLLLGGTGNDTLRGEANNDRIRGDAGNDVLIGGTGRDTADYASSTDGVTVDMTIAGFQVVSASAGSDRLIEMENVIGSNHDDTITGDALANVLRGRGGDDTLSGGGGVDRLIGGADADRLTGGAARDIFFFNDVTDSETGNRDTITDFGFGPDLIRLAAIDANTGVGGNQAFSFIGSAGFSGTAGELRFVAAGANGLVLADNDGDGVADLNILLLGVTSMSAGDFIL